MDDYDSFHCGSESFFVSLNSSFATTYLNSDEQSMLSQLCFDFEQPLVLDTTRNSIQVSCQVSQFSAFNTLYTVTSNNNFISITLSNGVIISDSISLGNHTSTTLVEWFNTESLFVASNLKISHDTLRQTFSIESEIDFVFNSISTCQKLLGFSISVDYSSTINILTSPYPGVLLGERSIFIHWVDIDTKNKSSRRMGQSNLIACCPVDPLSPAISFSDGPSFIIRQSVIDRIELRICDSTGALVDFRNSEWNLILKFTTIREIRKRQVGFFDTISRVR